MAVHVRPLFGVYYSEGEISLKNGSKIVLLRDSTSPFKGACLFTYSMEVLLTLYGPIQPNGLLYVCGTYLIIEENSLDIHS